jgi:hypothetical protein
LRPGLCSILKWDDEVVILKSQPAAIVLISSVLPDGAAEPKYLLQRVPIHRTKCHLGGERPWFNCIVCTSGKPCGRRAAKLYRVGHLFACRHCWGLVYASQQEIPVRRAMRRARKIKMNRCRKSRGACIGEPMSGCAHRRMPPTLKPTPCWWVRCPDLNPTAALPTPRRLAQNASAGAATAGSDQASPGRRHDISINSISSHGPRDTDPIKKGVISLVSQR